MRIKRLIVTATGDCDKCEDQNNNAKKKRKERFQKVVTNCVEFRRGFFSVETMIQYYLKKVRKPLLMSFALFNCWRQHPVFLSFFSFVDAFFCSAIVLIVNGVGKYLTIKCAQAEKKKKKKCKMTCTCVLRSFPLNHTKKIIIFTHTQTQILSRINWYLHVSLDVIYDMILSNLFQIVI